MGELSICPKAPKPLVWRIEVGGLQAQAASHGGEQPGNTSFLPPRPAGSFPDRTGNLLGSTHQTTRTDPTRPSGRKADPSPRPKM